MPATSFIAGNPVNNTTIAEGHRLLTQYLTPAGYAGVLLANPVAADSSPAGGLIPEADFAANGVPTDGTRIYLQVQIPDSPYPDSYVVSLVLLDLDAGKSLAETLV